MRTQNISTAVFLRICFSPQRPLLRIFLPQRLHLKEHFKKCVEIFKKKSKRFQNFRIQFGKFQGNFGNVQDIFPKNSEKILIFFGKLFFGNNFRVSCRLHKTRTFRSTHETASTRNRRRRFETLRQGFEKTVFCVVRTKLGISRVLELGFSFLKRPGNAGPGW